MTRVCPPHHCDWRKPPEGNQEKTWNPRNRESNRGKKKRSQDESCACAVSRPSNPERRGKEVSSTDASKTKPGKKSPEIALILRPPPSCGYWERRRGGQLEKRCCVKCSNAHQSVMTVLKKESKISHIFSSICWNDILNTLGQINYYASHLLLSTFLPMATGKARLPRQGAQYPSWPVMTDLVENCPRGSKRSGRISNRQKEPSADESIQGNY